MLRDIDNYFLQHDEQTNSCLQSLRAYILAKDKNLTEAWKYRMPMYYYKGKMCCYVWVHKKFKQPYVGIVEGSKVKHPDLLAEKRSRMKIILIDPAKDIPVKKLNDIFKQMLALYKD